MALETDRNALGRIDVASLAPTPAPVVEPRAVAALNEAFRSGLVTANDIVDRVAQRPAFNAQNKLAADPAVVEALRTTTLERANQEKLQTQAAQLALKQAQLQQQIPPQVMAIQKELAQYNWQVMPAGNTWTQENTNEAIRRWTVAENLKTKRASLAAYRDSLKKGGQQIVTERGTEIVPMNEASGQIQDPAKVAEVDNFLVRYQRPQQYDADGQPEAPDIFGSTAPGAVATSGATSGVTGTVGAPGDVGAPAVGARGTLIGPPGQSLKAMTEVQGRAALGAERFKAANAELQKLKAKGFDPALFLNATKSSLMVGPLEALKGDDLKSYEAAESAWIQGLLRMESGAAISAKEEASYRRAFFPRIGDSPVIQEQKERLRNAAEQIMVKIAQGQHYTPSDQAVLSAVRTGADALLTGSGAQGQPAGQTVNIPGLGTVQAVPTQDGRIRIVRSGTAPTTGGSANSYVAPAKLGAKPTPVVAPKTQKSPKIQDEPMRELNPVVEPKGSGGINFGRLKKALGDGK